MDLDLSEMAGMTAIRIRAADAEDAVFMTSMLISAMNWSSERLNSAAALLADPQVWQYIADWPLADDRGLIAVDEGGRPLGACWLRYRPSTGRGFGYIASDVPELTIAVRSEARRAGIGRTLLRAMADQARSRGVTAAESQCRARQSRRPPVPKRGMVHRQVRTRRRHNGAGPDRRIPEPGLVRRAYSPVS